MNGSYGRILTIDLDTQRVSVETLETNLGLNLLGGKGLATHLLLERNPAGVDPLAPENHLIFATGPATGSSSWGGCRYGVFTKSPQTGCYAESYSGGRVPEAIAATGFDAILIRGACAAPTVLRVSPEGVTSNGADDLLGQETYAIADRGACHLRATFYKPELSGMLAPDQVAGKAELFVDFEDRLTLFDTLIFCRFYRDLYPWETLQEMIQALTSIEADIPRLRRMATAITTLTRRFNLREGLTAADDRLPRQLHRQLADSGRVVTEDEIETMVQDHYRLRGWNRHGIPPA